METGSVDAKSLDARELAPALLWLKLLFFATMASGLAMCLTGLVILSGQI